jgi:hypothetical protein
MKQETRRRKWRWGRHVVWVLAVKIVVIIVGFVIFFGSGAGNPLIRRFAIRRLEGFTGAQVDIQTISIRWLSLEATVKGLVIHGREPAGTEALFAAEEIRAGLRVDSFWGRKVSLNDLSVQRPMAHMRVEPDGSTNLPVLRSSSGKKPTGETLLDLRVRRLQVENGWLLYNDVHTAGGRGRRPAFGVERQRHDGSSAVLGDPGLAIHAVYGEAIPTLAGQHLGKIHDIAGRFYARTRRHQCRPLPCGRIRRAA